MQNYLISIIMPLYNAEKYLSEALQSVSKQTFRNYEIICINDGSTDGTESILKKFQMNDSRIRILTNTERLGAANSRNRGIEEALGKYIVFWDGDDIFEEQLLEKASEVLEEENVNMVVYECMSVPSRSIYEKRRKKHTTYFIDHYCKRSFSVKDFKPSDFPIITGSPCDKMLSREFIKKNELLFQNLQSSNDVYFSQMSFLCADRILFLNDERIMVYARVHNEPSRISNDRDPMCAYYAMEKLGEELKDRNMFSETAQYYYKLFAERMLSYLNNEKRKERKHFFYNFLHDKGVAYCIGLGKDMYEKTDECYKQVLFNFQTQPYESAWFENAKSYFEFCLYKNGEKFCNIVRDNLQKGKKVILWGCGKNGMSLLHYLNECSIKLFAVVDVDKAKQGNKIEGYTIIVPQSVIEEADVILTVSSGVYSDIQKCTYKKNIINVLEVLTVNEDKMDIAGE